MLNFCSQCKCILKEGIKQYESTIQLILILSHFLTLNYITFLIIYLSQFALLLMGNSYTRDKDLLIYIETEKPFYNSGSNIEGTVFVQAKKNFTFDSLYIRVEGDEWNQWFEGSSKNRQKFTGSQNFYGIQHKLQQYNTKTLQAGRYAYPFLIQLSENIPGSFQSKEHQAKIQYKLAAYFVNYLEQNNKEIQYIPLHIRQPFRQELVCYQGTSTQQPKTCGCFAKGKVTINATFDRNVCFQDETVHIEGNVDNSLGSTSIDRVTIELVQNIFVSSNTGIHRTYNNPIKAQNVLGKTINKGQTSKFSYDFKIPSVQHQTAIGTLVANHYRLQVSTQIGSISSDNPCVYSPLFILKKQFQLKSLERPYGLSQNLKDYKIKRKQFFKASQYWFKKNMNLSIMNFRLQDHLEY